MEKPKPSFERTAEIYGLITAVGLLLLFLLAQVIGIAKIVELRALIFFIMAGGIIKALQVYKKKGGNFNFLNGLAMGIFVAVVGAILFAIFVFVYTSFINPPFMEYLKVTQPFGEHLNPYMVSVAIIIEGIGSGLILSFIVINYMGLLKREP